MKTFFITMIRTAFVARAVLAGCVAWCGGCASPGGAAPETYYEQHVDFGQADSVAKIDMAARLVPSARQLNWQKWELTAFIHFTVNTFTGKEWGDGKESPDLFAPSAIDTDQWVETLGRAGFKMVMLTAKHHDGFCLWPTETTPHSVKNSAWMDGKGDVVAMLRKSCDKYGMKMGLYLSPWDRNAPCYGTGKEYDDLFVAQLTELLTRYGEIAEVWFDGANGSEADGKHQVYDWARYMATVEKLQPGAVTAIKGNDIRWVGNEAGKGRDEEWSATALAPEAVVLRDPDPMIESLTETSPDLGGRAVVAKAKELFWFPSEVDVSIRPGWFYHAEEDDKVKSLDELKRIYFASVGSNSVLLLNVPPDRRGRIHENDAERLREFGEWLRSGFEKGLLADGNVEWSAEEGQSRVFEVAADEPFDVVMLQEDIERGQRVERFRVEMSDDGTRWSPLAEGTTIGYKRLLRLPEEVKAAKIRVTVDRTRAKANIANVQCYRVG